MIPRRAHLVAALLALAATRAQAFTINLNPDAGLAANPAALDAFQRAADQWANAFSDPVTINIDAGLSLLPDGILGSTSATVLYGDYAEIRDQLVADSLLDGSDDAIVAALPTFSQFGANIPTGTALSGFLYATKANLKAMGFANLDAAFGASDAGITFNALYDFDFDNRDGVTLGLTDFETVAAHEIGHALGFLSTVDEVNAGETSISPYTLDLFRFQDGVVGSDPTSAADFTFAKRDLVPGHNAIFDDTVHEWLLSTGTEPSVFPDIDGRQASHWKDDELTGFPGPLVGLMDPSLAPANFFGYPFVEHLSHADLRALDLIGYDAITLPEPATVAALLGFALVRRHR